MTSVNTSWRGKKLALFRVPKRRSAPPSSECRRSGSASPSVIHAVLMPRYWRVRAMLPDRRAAAADAGFYQPQALEFGSLLARLLRTIPHAITTIYHTSAATIIVNGCCKYCGASYDEHNSNLQELMERCHGHSFRSSRHRLCSPYTAWEVHGGKRVSRDV
jgi:hypothetical protein